VNFASFDGTSWTVLHGLRFRPMTTLFLFNDTLYTETDGVDIYKYNGTNWYSTGFSSYGTNCIIYPSLLHNRLMVVLNIQFNYTFEVATPQHMLVIKPFVKYSTPGDFDVTLKVSNAFGSDSVTIIKMIHVDNCTVNLVNEIDKSSLKIFPNPFYNDLNIESD